MTPPPRDAMLPVLHSPPFMTLALSAVAILVLLGCAPPPPPRQVLPPATHAAPTSTTANVTTASAGAARNPAPTGPCGGPAHVPQPPYSEPPPELPPVSAPPEKTVTLREGKPCQSHPEATALADEARALLDSDVSAAIRKYEDATLQGHQDHRIMFGLASAYLRHEDLDKAASTLARTTDLAPHFPRYWATLAEVYLKQAKLVGLDATIALPALRSCLAADATFARCYELLGDAYRMDGQLGLAIARYRRAIMLQPHAGPFDKLAAVYQLKGDAKAAARVRAERARF